MSEELQGTHESFYRVLELRLQPITGRFDAQHLKAIHGHIFQDHPEFSPGQYREPRDFPHYVKNRKLEAGVTRHRVHYMPHNYPARVDQILADFGGIKGLQGLPLDQAADRLAKLYGDLDHAHPFVEGNSRTLRTFTQQLAKEAGYRLDWDTTTANPLTRDQLYIARDVAVTQRAFPGLDMQRAMDTENRAEYFAYVEVLSPHAKKPTLRDLIGKNLALDKPELAKGTDVLGDAERQARQLLGKDGAQVRAATGTGVYVGAIVGETPTHWIQRLSPNTAILHDKTAVAGAAVGQVGTLRYRQGQAQLAPSKDQDRAHTLSR